MIFAKNTKVEKKAVISKDRHFYRVAFFANPGANPHVWQCNSVRDGVRIATMQGYGNIDIRNVCVVKGPNGARDSSWHCLRRE